MPLPRWKGRATRVHDAVDTAFALSNDGAIRWLGEPVAKIIADVSRDGDQAVIRYMQKWTDPLFSLDQYKVAEADIAGDPGDIPDLLLG